MTLREDFYAALVQLAKATTYYQEKTNNKVVIVGGAATALLTDGSFNSNDFDMVASIDNEFNNAMLHFGFRKEDRSGKLRVGWYHPNHENYGFQLVTPPLFEGRTSYDRLIKLYIDNNEINLPPIEDMIADRLAQQETASKTDESRLKQAEVLFQFAQKLSEPKLDLEYLKKRIMEEGGDYRRLLSP